MPQDSGAFKTIPRNCSGFGLIRATALERQQCPGARRLAGKNLPPARPVQFLTSGFLHLRYSGFSLIRSDLAVIAMPRGRRSLWLTASLMAQGPSQQAKAEHHFMLPGLRFLFVAIVLSLSMLIFGFGAAALLRSAHEEFASLPTKRAQPETVFAQPVEAPRQTVAMLRVDPPVTDHNGTDRPAGPHVPNAAPLTERPSPPASTPAAPDRIAAEPDRVAALTAEGLSEANPKFAATPAQADTAARAGTPAAPVVTEELKTQEPKTQELANQEPENQTAATQTSAPPAPISSAANDATAAASEPASATADGSANAAPIKIATLGGPAVTIEPQTASNTPATAPGKR